MIEPPEEAANIAGYRHDALLAVGDDGSVRSIIGVEIFLGWGLAPHPPLPVHLVDLVHPGRLGEVAELVQASLDVAGLAIPGTVRFRHADGRWLSMYVEVECHGHNPDIGGGVLRLRPVDGVADPRPPDAGQFEVLAEVVAAGIMTADETGAVQFANPAARELFWRSEHDLLGDGWLAAVHPDDQQDVESVADQTRLRGISEVADFRVAVSGLERWLRGRFSAIPGVGSDGSGWVAMFEDTTAARADVIELAHQATHDPLTGLANRMLLADRLSGALARARRSGSPLAVLFCDLDRFKDANDRYGHHVGDDLLREVSRRLVDTVRAEDTAARLGGDEFVVVAEGIDRVDASQLAGRIAERIAAPIAVDAGEVELGVSIGVAWTTRADLAPDDLLSVADSAMYEAKTTSLGLIITTLT